MASSARRASRMAASSCVAARAQLVDALVGERGPPRGRRRAPAGRASRACRPSTEVLRAGGPARPRSAARSSWRAVETRLDLALRFLEPRGLERDRRGALEQPGVDGHRVPHALGPRRARPRGRRTAGAARAASFSSTVCCSAIRLPDRRAGLGLARIEPGDLLLRPAHVELDQLLLLPHAGRWRRRPAPRAGRSRRSRPPAGGLRRSSSRWPPARPSGGVRCRPRSRPGA